MIRRHAEWMEPIDDRLLELLYDENKPMSSEAIQIRLSELSSQLNYPKEYINARIDRLLFYRLITTDSESWQYTLSQYGRAYLHGNLDVSTLSQRTNSNEGSDLSNTTWNDLDRID